MTRHPHPAVWPRPGVSRPLLNPRAARRIADPASAAFRSGGPHRTERTRVIKAAPGSLYRTVADVERWSAIFPSVVHVRSLERTGRGERCELWAWEDGGITTWTGSQVADPERLAIAFSWTSEQLTATVSGSWHFRGLPGERTEVILRDRFRAGSGDPAGEDRIRRILDRRGHEQFDALVRIASLATAGAPSPVFSFTDSFPVTGTAVEHYDVMRRADLWAERLPHVARSTVTELLPGVDALELDIIGAEGLARRTRSVQVCQDPAWIAHKELVTTSPLVGHSGVWTFTEGLGGPLVTARHTVVVDPAAAAGTYGDDVPPDAVRAEVRATLRRTGLAVLGCAPSPVRSPRTAKAS
ncbi:SRPBCC family protein [Streptomyces sp. NPDC056411]|uniref:SRPBCC family protein n=1 Tax=Streptomyces sp. NPDC056411 TaxID=3345813 RepID=UPI0035D6215F